MPIKCVSKFLYYPKVRRISSKKLINFYRSEKGYREKKSTLNSNPTIAVIDPTNICNLTCPMCPTGQGRQNKRGWMEVDLFRKIMGELSPYLFEVWLYNWGEPFLNSSIFELIEITNESNISSTISTNLNYFPEVVDVYIYILLLCIIVVFVVVLSSLLFCVLVVFILFCCCALFVLVEFREAVSRIGTSLLQWPLVSSVQCRFMREILWIGKTMRKCRNPTVP